MVKKDKIHRKYGNGLGYHLSSTMSTGIMKEIPDFPGYFIAKNGRIWSNKKYKEGIFLKPSRCKGGYKFVGLQKGGKRYTKKIHRLVLETFVGQCPEGMESCHNNGNKLDNRLGNLRWDTPQNNQADAIRHGTHASLIQRGESHNRAKLTEQDVRTIIYLWRTNLFTKQEIADMYNVTSGNIRSIVNRKSWKHIWETNR